MSPSPNIILLHGDDELAIAQKLAAYQAELGDPSMAELNTTRLDGRTMAAEDLWNAAGAMPFLSPYRLVTVTNPVPKASKVGTDLVRDRLMRDLERIPPTTILVLVVYDHQDRRGKWELLVSGHWLAQWAASAGEKACRITCALPKPGEMTTWVIKQAKSLGGSIAPAAAGELARHTGNDTRLVDLEIRKLLEYVDYARPVEAADVSLLCGYGDREVDVFAMVDALANGNRSQAMERIDRMLEEEDTQRVFSSIVRHYRQLLGVRELRDQRGGQQDILVQLGAEPFRISSPYVADKLVAQAGRHSLEHLKSIYRRLLDMDLALKSSQDARAVFAAFVAENT